MWGGSGCRRGPWGPGAVVVRGVVVVRGEGSLSVGARRPCVGGRHSWVGVVRGGDRHCPWVG